jgi:MFS family permease
LLTRWISRSGLIATLITFALTASPVLSMVLVVVLNDIMAVSLVMAGLALVLLASDSERSGRARTLALFGGLFLALATGTKQSFVILPLSAAVFTLFLASAGAFRHRVFDLFLPLVVGGIAGSLPAIALALIEWPNFLFATVEYHLTAHAEWNRRHSQSEVSRTVRSVLRLAKYTLNGSNVFPALVMAAGLCLALPNLARSPLFSRSTREGRSTLLALTGIAFGTPLMLMATPLHVHYTAPLLLYQAIGCAAAAHALWGQAATPAHRAIYLAAAGLIVAGVAVFAFLNPRPTGHPVHDAAYYRVLHEGELPIKPFPPPAWRAFAPRFTTYLAPPIRSFASPR